MREIGGDRGIRTPDLRDANATLSRLSHIPNYMEIITYVPVIINVGQMVNSAG